MKEHAKKCKTSAEAVLSENYECDCDGYHTFDELYEHRIALFIALCKQIKEDPRHQYTPIWKSKKHSDGSTFDGWFVMGMGSATGSQITYHLPMSRWDETDFADEREVAWPWDGHTSDDVLERLKDLTPNTP